MRSGHINFRALVKFVTLWVASCGNLLYFCVRLEWPEIGLPDCMEFINTEPFWYVAQTCSCMEKRMSAILDDMGVTHYLPVQRVEKQYSDRRKVVEKPVIPRVIFVFTTEKVRRELMRDIPNFIFHSCLACRGKVLHVPQDQIDVFRAMVESPSEVLTVTPAQFVAGEKVRIKSGPFMDLVVQLVQVEGRRCMAVNLNGLGAFAINVTVECLEKIES